MNVRVVFPPGVEAGSPLQRQAVDRHVVRGKLPDPLHGAAHIVRGLVWKTSDEVRVDIVKAQGPRQTETLPELVHGVPPSDQVQSLLLQGLGVDGDPCDAAFLQCLQLLRSDAVRPPGFHREFLQVLKVKALPDSAEDALQLRRFQAGRRPAAHVDGLQLPAPHHLRDGPKLPAEGIDVGCHLIR